MISFLAGKPNADTFPFSAIKVDLKPLVRPSPSTFALSRPVSH